MNALEIIREKSNDLSQLKQKLANYILSNWEDVAFLSAGQLSRVVGISESVIVRFACDVGFSGYPALQEAIQALVKDRLSLVDMYRHSSGSINEVEVVNRILNNDINNLRSTLEQCPPEDIVSAVDLITKARRIIVVASRSSSGPAQILTLYLNEILGNTQFHSYGIGDIYDQLRPLDSRDLVIGISFAWYTRNTIEALEFGKSRGCKILSITDTHGSPLKELGDVSLFTKVNGISYFLSHTATLGLINVLLYLVSQQAGERSVKALTEMQEIYKKYYNATDKE